MSGGRRVAIIGGGVGGLTLAKTILFHQPDASVVVYEAWDEVKAWDMDRGGSLGVSLGIYILQALGLEQPFRAKANSIHNWVSYSNGALVAKTDFKGRLNYIMRGDLMRILNDSLPSGTVQINRKVIHVTEGGSEVTITFADETTVTADVVVGADGFDSIVKREIFGPSTATHSGYRFIKVVTKTEVRKSELDTVKIHWTQDNGCGWHLMEWTAGQGNSRHDVFIALSKDLADLSAKWDKAKANQKVKEIVKGVAAGPDHEGWRLAAQSAEQDGYIFDVGVYKHPVMPSWISPKGKVVLLGDAAHPMAPFLGQGANQAMIDGWCLGRLLSCKDVAMTDALKRYEKARKEDAEGIVKKSLFLGGLFTATGCRSSVRNLVQPFVMAKVVRELGVDPTAKLAIEGQKPRGSILRRFICFCCAE